jgi:phospholipid/cholesterol/gamma-HCH transport system permease protein
MRNVPFLQSTPSQWAGMLGRFIASWWRMVHLAAVAIVMAFSPSTYNRSNSVLISRYLYNSTWQVLPWFTLLAALVSMVLIRIVLVTALSYGLSRYALEMVVRVLVLELIPLSAALFVALRAGMVAGPASTQLKRDLVPRVIANAFAVLSLAMVSSMIVLVLAYLNVYGFSPWGLGDYTRTVGRVFDPVVTIGFALKTVLFGLAVAVIPTAATLEARRYGRSASATVQPGAVRMLLVLVMIEGLSLAVKYI